MTSVPVTQRPKAVRILRRFLRYLFSQIGILFLVVCYCVGGAYLFAYIESDAVAQKNRNAVNASKQIELERQQLLNDLLTLKCTDNCNATVARLLNDYQRSIARAIQQYGYVGRPMTEAQLDKGWEFASAFLFTVSVVTTIGFGHVTPITPVGRMVIIPYALLGIPLMLLFLANVGDSMADVFRRTYFRGCCFICWKIRKRKQVSSTWPAVSKPTFSRLAAEDLAVASDVKSDLVRSSTSVDIPGMVGHSRRRSASECVATDRATDARPAATGGNRVFIVQSFPSSRKLDDDESSLNVPISLTVLVVLGYLVIGAAMFSLWNNWSWTAGAYFSFTTLSTIGFGDLIPGLTQADSAVGSAKLVISALYIVFGLAVVSMCFNLMMDSMLEKFLWLGRQIGVVQTPVSALPSVSKSDRSPDSVRAEE